MLGRKQKKHIIIDNEKPSVSKSDMSSVSTIFQADDLIVIKPSEENQSIDNFIPPPGFRILGQMIEVVDLLGDDSCSDVLRKFINNEVIESRNASDSSDPGNDLRPTASATNINELKDGNTSTLRNVEARSNESIKSLKNVSNLVDNRTAKYSYSVNAIISSEDNDSTAIHNIDAEKLSTHAPCDSKVSRTICGLENEFNGKERNNKDNVTKKKGKSIKILSTGKIFNIDDTTSNESDLERDE